MKQGRQYLHLRFAVDRFEARYDRHSDTHCTAPLFKFKEIFIVKEKLGHYIVRTCIYFLLEVPEVSSHVWRLEVLLRIGCYAYTEVRLHFILGLLMEKLPLIHRSYLCHQVIGKTMLRLCSCFQFLRAFIRITFEQEKVVYAQIVECKERILCFLFGKAATDQMRYCVHVKLSFKRCADAHRARSLAQGYFFYEPVYSFLIYDLFFVVGHIYKRRFELHERGYHSLQVVYGLTLLRG